MSSNNSSLAGSLLTGIVTELTSEQLNSSCWLVGFGVMFDWQSLINEINSALNWYKLSSRCAVLLLWGGFSGSGFSPLSCVTVQAFFASSRAATFSNLPCVSSVWLFVKKAMAVYWHLNRPKSPVFSSEVPFLSRINFPIFSKYVHISATFDAIRVMGVGNCWSSSFYVTLMRQSYYLWRNRYWFFVVFRWRRSHVLSKKTPFLFGETPMRLTWLT